jgi:ABC-2 type transport system permease protein
MSQVLTIAKREVLSLFVSLVAYFVLFLFLASMGILFVWQVFIPGRMVEVRNLIDMSRFILFFIVPLLTMSLFSDEYRSGRVEILRTSPITELQLLLGKFIGAMTFYLFLVASSLIFLVLLMMFGKPDYGQVVSSYVGMFFMGFMFVAVGLFFSACTREQILAALSSIMSLGFLVALSYFASSLPKTLFWKIPLRPVAEYLAVGTHIADFTRGSIELTNMVYFTGFGLVFLFLTYLVLESKKWR